MAVTATTEVSFDITEAGDEAGSLRSSQEGKVTTVVWSCGDAFHFATIDVAELIGFLNGVPEAMKFKAAFVVDALRANYNTEKADYEPDLSNRFRFSTVSQMDGDQLYIEAHGVSLKWSSFVSAFQSLI